MSLAPQVVSPPRECAQGEGFLWWYLDLVDAHGNGVVLIWSWGLPFLPGRIHARRAQRPEPAHTAPSLNVVCYRNHREDFYLLQRLAPEDAHWDQEADGHHTWRWGRTVISSSRESGQVCLRVALDVDVPTSSSPLRGTLNLRGPQRGPLPHATPPTSPHVWCPIVPLGWGEADLTQGTRRWQVQGRAYHDLNHSTVCLAHLGIDRWVWGRAGDDQETWIYYLLWPTHEQASPELHLLRHTPEGDVHQTTPQVTLDAPLRKRGFGMRHVSDFTLDGGDLGSLRVHTEGVVDDGPFYLRSLTRVTLPDGREVAGVEEAVEPARIDLDRHRPLVRMRVHDTTGNNSFWLPLFSGPREGRWSRLLTRSDRRANP